MPVKNELEEQMKQASAAHGDAYVRQAISGWRRSRRKFNPTTRRRAVPRAWTLAALLRQGGRCYLCGMLLDKKAAVGDHVMPLNKGGEDNEGNIGATHQKCNAKKTDHDLQTESKRLGRTLLSLLTAAKGAADES